MTMGNRSRKNNVSLAKQVKQVLDSRVEHKRITTTSLTGNNWATAGVISEISTDIAQGDTIATRDGTTIFPKRLKFKLTSFNTAAFGLLVGRIILFHDSMVNGVAPTVTDVLAFASYLAPYNTFTRQERRFKVLCDSTLTSVGTTHTGIVEVDRSFPLKGTINYLTAGPGAASAGRNSIYALFIADSATASVKTYAWTYELEFTDS